jgi:hypothetical protein
MVTTVEQGPPGAPAPIAQLTVTAGEALSGHRAVLLTAGEAFYADHATLTHAGRAIGVTTGAAALGDTVTIQTLGILIEPTWTWTEGPVYLGAQGALTQTPPATGFVQIIGVATTATALFVAPHSAILR